MHRFTDPPGGAAATDSPSARSAQPTQIERLAGFLDGPAENRVFHRLPGDEIDRALEDRLETLGERQVAVGDAWRLGIEEIDDDVDVAAGGIEFTAGCGTEQAKFPHLQASAELAEPVPVSGDEALDGGIHE